MIFGRVTYEMMASYWPTSSEPEAGMMNELPKLVFSRTMKETSWQNARMAKESVRVEVAKLKAQPGKNIALIGSSDLASTVIRHGLIDEYLLLVNPVVLGAGQPLFKGLTERLSLRLERTQTFRSLGGGAHVHSDQQERLKSYVSPALRIAHTLDRIGKQVFSVGRQACPPRGVLQELVVVLLLRRHRDGQHRRSLIPIEHGARVYIGQ
jgi:dihydrofolate reductase